MIKEITNDFLTDIGACADAAYAAAYATGAAYALKIKVLNYGIELLKAEF